MSSCLTSYAQVIPKVKNSQPRQIDPNADLLLNTFDVDIPFVVYYPSAITDGLAYAQSEGYSYTQVGSVIDTPSYDALIAVTTAIGNQKTRVIVVGSLLRDLGKEIDIKLNGMLAARLRLVEFVRNANTFGHSGDIFYVITYCSEPYVFDSDPFILCSRTGSCPQKLPNSQFFTSALPNGYGYFQSSIPNGLAETNISYTNTGSTIDVSSVANMQTLHDAIANQVNQNIELSVGTLVKDLGKTVDFTVNGQLSIRWSLVQIVQGATTEGVPPITIDAYGNDTSTFYITTFCADQDYYNDLITCVRTGSSMYNSPETQFFVNPIDLSGTWYYEDGIAASFQEAITAGVPFTQDGSRYNTTDLNSMIALYEYIQGNGEHYPAQGPPQLLFRDIGKNIDFTIQGKLAIRLRLCEFQGQYDSEGGALFVNIVYMPVFVSDSAVFGEEVGVARTG